MKQTQKQLLKLISEVDRETSGEIFQVFLTEDLPKNDYSDADDITELLEMIVKSLQYFEESVFESRAVAETDAMLIRENELEYVRKML